MIKTKKVPLFLSVKDMMIITGKCKASVCRMRAGIKKHFNKQVYADISLEHFCEFTGLNEEKVKTMLE